MSLTLMPPAVATPIAPIAFAPTETVVNEKARAFEELIRKTGYRDLRKIEVSLRDGWVILRGNVPSYYMKQVAQESVRPLAIGLRIKNMIKVIGNHPAQRI